MSTHIKRQRIDEFWRWFSENLSNFNLLNNSAVPFWDDALDQLHRIDKDLWFELSRPDDEDRDLIFTAQGRMDLFHLVEEIVSLAPRISGWRFLSLKPPQGFKFTTEYEGVLFDPSSMWFFPLENRSQPEDLGLRIGVPDFLEENKQQMLTAVLTLPGFPQPSPPLLSEDSGRRELALMVRMI